MKELSCKMDVSIVQHFFLFPNGNVLVRQVRAVLSLLVGIFDCEQIRSRINQQLIAGHFGHEGLRQLCTKTIFYTSGPLCIYLEQASYA